MAKAIYAFSGDPITYGHVDIIKRTASVFDEVSVCIGINPDKKYLFSLEERLDMAKRTLKDYSNVKVDSFEGMLVDYARKNNIDLIVKGVRNSADFDYENILEQVNISQEKGIDTYVLFANPELAHISSSAVKGIQKAQGDLRKYVSSYVKQKLEEKLSKQYIIGITGEMGSGKSYIANKLVEWINKNKSLEWKDDKTSDMDVYNIELDHIGHKILGEWQEPMYKNVREEIFRYFGNDVKDENGFVDRKILGKKVFNNENDENLKKLNEIMKTPLRIALRQELYGKKGLIILNSALIAESDMSYMCNNNVLLVNANKETQQKRIMARCDLSDDQIQRRLLNQFNYAQKEEYLKNQIEKTGNGNIWYLDNSEGKNELEKVYNKIKYDLNI